MQKMAVYDQPCGLRFSKAGLGMKKKNYIAIIALILVLSVLEPCQIFATSRESYSLNLSNDFIKTTFTSGFGDTPILLRKGC